jgi:hypothetical protein
MPTLYQPLNLLDNAWTAFHAVLILLIDNQVETFMNPEDTIISRLNSGSKGPDRDDKEQRKAHCSRPAEKTAGTYGLVAVIC